MSQGTRFCLWKICNQVEWRGRPTSQKGPEWGSHRMRLGPGRFHSPNYGIVSLPSAEPCRETDLPAMVREVLIWMA